MATIRLLAFAIGSIFISVHDPFFTAMGLIVLNATTILHIPIISKDTTRLEFSIILAVSCRLRLQPCLFIPDIQSLLLVAMWVGMSLVHSRIVSVLHLKEKEVESDGEKEVADDDVEEEVGREEEEEEEEEEEDEDEKEEEEKVKEEEEEEEEKVKEEEEEEEEKEEEEKEEEEEEEEEEEKEEEEEEGENLVVEVGYYNQMVQRMVPLFEKQREKNYQFAVLYLSSERKLSIENTKFRTRLGEVIDSYEATDCSKSTFPQDDNLGNFIAGRPKAQHHAEKKILNRFEKLWGCYNSSNSEPCHHIVLYTWMLPCNYCKDEIIRVLGPHSKECQITVVFTIIQKNVTIYDAVKIIRELQHEKVKVKIVKYGKKLSCKYLP